MNKKSTLRSVANDYLTHPKPTVSIDELLELSEEQLKQLNFHCTPIEKMESIDSSGFKADIGDNGDGEFGNQPNPEVFFSQGLEYVLQMVNRAIRLAMFTIENRSNEHGKQGMKALGIADYYKKVEKDFDNISKENLQIESITPKLKKSFYSVVKNMLSNRTYYILDLTGCTRDEYDKKSLEDKMRIDYLLDDYNEEYFKKDENGERTIPDPEHKVTPNNMHTISGKGVSTEKIHRITKSDGSVLNGFEFAMKMCEKYKQMNPGKPLPLILNKDGSGDNWLEDFYGQYKHQELIKDEVGDEHIPKTQQQETKDAEIEWMNRIGLIAQEVDKTNTGVKGKQEVVQLTQELQARENLKQAKLQEEQK